MIIKQRERQTEERHESYKWTNNGAKEMRFSDSMKMREREENEQNMEEKGENKTQTIAEDQYIKYNGNIQE